ncbi:MAG: UPF0280 family protein [Candidatus Hadarchaeota archaeon]|nr:UPF0280 family protein [Candidatus Hadarchaeota archaeon]
MYERKWAFRETELTIKSDSERAIEVAIGASLEARRQLEKFVARYPEFRSSLEPVRLDEDSYPKVVELMLRAAEIVGVGPFAAVAGSISQLAAEAGMGAGAANILVDNGGDISMIGDRDFRVGIYAGDSTVSGKFALLVKAEDLPLGVCTSSGSIGHSTSFGDADAVVVVAREASVADAAATAVANEVRGSEVDSSIRRGLDRARAISEIQGCLIVRGKNVGTYGKFILAPC